MKSSLTLLLLFSTALLADDATSFALKTEVCQARRAEGFDFLAYGAIMFNFKLLAGGEGFV
jgi:hypothetical protein